jgi:dihydrofolate reductase
MEIKAIAAMSLNRVIGDDQDIPWNISEDFKHFKNTTMGDTLVMGRKTYESIGKPLPGRSTVVLSRSGTPIKGVKVVKSIKELLKLKTVGTVWIAGGGEIYKALLPHCSEIILSLINLTVDGDTFFPEFENEFTFKENILEQPEFTVQKWIR